MYLWGNQSPETTEDEAVKLTCKECFSVTKRRCCVGDGLFTGVYRGENSQTLITK